MVVVDHECHFARHLRLIEEEQARSRMLFDDFELLVRQARCFLKHLAVEGSFAGVMEKRPQFDGGYLSLGQIERLRETAGNMLHAPAVGVELLITLPHQHSFSLRIGPVSRLR